MLKTMLTIAGVLALVQAVQLPAAEAQSGDQSPNSSGSPAVARATVGFDGSGLLAPQGGKDASQPGSSSPSGFVCCVSPEGRSPASPE